MKYVQSIIPPEVLRISLVNGDIEDAKNVVVYGDVNGAIFQCENVYIIGGNVNGDIMKNQMVVRADNIPI